MTDLHQEQNGFKAQAGIEKRRRVIFGELIHRTRWFIRLRWFAPPVIALVAVGGRMAGLTADLSPFFLITIFILFYNFVLFAVSKRNPQALAGRRNYILAFNRFQCFFDFVSLFLLIHFTGGITSPLIFFLIFHVIFASTLLTPGSGYGFAALTVSGLIVVYFAESSGWLQFHPLCFGNTPSPSPVPKMQAMVILIFYAAFVFFTAHFSASVVHSIRRRISELVDLTEAIRELNKKLNSLYSMTETVGSGKNLTTVLGIVTSELCRVMNVLGTSVKLLSEDGKLLEYVAADGLVADVFKSKVIEVDKSPLNREIINGKPFVTGSVRAGEMLFQFGEDLAAANVQSVLFVPLVVSRKVIGIVGAYCESAGRFSSEDVDFFRRAAGLVAIAIENARSYEAIEKLMNERNRFMMRVAHNLRSPLAAMISMTDVVRGGYMGGLNEGQSEYLRRIDRRTRTMISTINGLLTLSEGREAEVAHDVAAVDPDFLAGRIQRTFQDKAKQKGLGFEVTVRENLPPIFGNADMLEQALENLVANAVKYTRSGGKVTVEFSKASEQMVGIRIRDTGIGISREDREKLFTEFFRAENARAMEEMGTGLGLAIVKQIIDKHNGRIEFESEPGRGTMFEVFLPVAPERRGS